MFAALSQSRHYCISWGAPRCATAVAPWPVRRVARSRVAGVRASWDSNTAKIGNQNTRRKLTSAAQPLTAELNVVTASLSSPQPTDGLVGWMDGMEKKGGLCGRACVRACQRASVPARASVCGWMGERRGREGGREGASGKGERGWSGGRSTSQTQTLNDVNLGGKA